MVNQMAQFVDDHVVDNAHGRDDDLPVKMD